MQQKAKIEIPCDKRQWHPSPLPGQVVMVTTCSRDGQPNVAPKSWISMVAFNLVRGYSVPVLLVDPGAVRQV